MCTMKLIGIIVFALPLLVAGQSDPANDPACPLWEPRQFDSCDFSGRSCNYDPLTCPASVPFEIYGKTCTCNGVVDCQANSLECAPIPDSSPDNANACPATKPPSNGMSCTPTPDICQYDPIVCGDSQVLYITNCECNTDNEMECVTEVPFCAFSSMCPQFEPQEGGVCFKDLSCRYEPNACPGSRTVDFGTECDCVTEEGPIRRWRCSTDAEEPDCSAFTTKCPRRAPKDGDDCNPAVLLREVCRYEPFGCPEDVLTPGEFLHTCRCDPFGKYGCESRVTSCGTFTSERPKAGVTVGLICFSGSSLVEVQDTRGRVPMKELRIGDVVHVGHDKYEPIYSFGHYGPHVVGEFWEIATTGSASKLQISDTHMVSTPHRGFVAASTLSPGDSVWNGDQTRELTIQSMRLVRGQPGVFAPFTPSGTIVVDGILCSTFVALTNQDSISLLGGALTLSHQWLAHSYEAFHRQYCSSMGGCAHETYTTDGLSTWVAGPRLTFATWLLNSSGWLREALIVLVVAVLCIASMLERTYCSVTIMTILLSVAWYRPKGKVRK